MGFSDGYRTSDRSPTRIDYERVKKNGFLNDRVLVVSIDDDRISWVDRQHLINIGERLYGPLKKA